MKMKRKSGGMDVLKAVRRGSREAEIELHGRPIGHTKVHKSKKVYNRKSQKAEDRKLPPSSFLHTAA